MNEALFRQTPDGEELRNKVRATISEEMVHADNSSLSAEEVEFHLTYILDELMRGNLILSEWIGEESK